MGSRSPHLKGQFWWGKGWLIVKFSELCKNRLPILNIYTLYDVDLQRDVPFSCGIDNAAHLWAFWGMNRHFSQTRYILKTLMLSKLPPDSNQMLYSDKHYQMFSVCGRNMLTTSTLWQMATI